MILRIAGIRVNKELKNTAFCLRFPRHKQYNAYKRRPAAKAEIQ